MIKYNKYKTRRILESAEKKVVTESNAICGSYNKMRKQKIQQQVLSYPQKRDPHDTRTFQTMRALNIIDVHSKYI